jgi:hypothetical protein
MKLLATAMFAVVLCGATAPAPTPSASPREALSDAWWTGPMLAPSAGTLPRGHTLVEPYVFDVMSQHSNTYGNLTYIIYGLADRLSVGLVPTFGFTTVQDGPASSGVQFGDLTLLSQYKIAQYRTGSWIPTTSINVQETLPTGKYDRLGGRPSNGFGSGAYTTTVSLYTQTYFWMPSGRILRFRLNASQAFSSSASVDGVSVYGTADAFHGYAKPGKAFTLDLAQEYSVTQNWVVALDLVYRHAGGTLVTGGKTATNSGSSDTYALAPAVEYNWSPNAGILVGVRAVPAGVNTSATLTPAVAINIVR